MNARDSVDTARVVGARELVRSLDAQLPTTSRAARKENQGAWMSFIKRITRKEEDVAALWVAFPRAAAQRVNVDFDIALYYDDGVADEAARFMSGRDCERPLELLRIYDALLGVDDAYTGVLSIAFSAGKVDAAFTADSIGAQAYVSGLSRVVELVTCYGDDRYSMAMLASFSKTVAKANPRRSLEEVLGDYNRVERTMLTMVRETAGTGSWAT